MKKVQKKGTDQQKERKTKKRHMSTDVRATAS